MSNFGVKAADGSCADKLRGEGDDSLLGYFYQRYSHNPLSWWEHLPTRRAEAHTAAVNHLSGSTVHTALGMGERETDISCFLAAVCMCRENAEMTRSRCMTLLSPSPHFWSRGPAHL